MSTMRNSPVSDLHLPSRFCPLSCPVKQQDVIVDLAAAGGAIMG